MIDLNADDIKKIIGNKNNAVNFLVHTNIKTPHKELSKLKSEEVYDLLMSHFDYDTFHLYVRLESMKSKYSNDNFLKYSKKYIECAEIIENRYNNNKSWAFNPSTYEDEQINTIRRHGNIGDSIKEHLEKCEKNLIIKSYNNSRSFLFEYFLIRSNDKILPTLSNSKGVDLFFNRKWDLKNTSGVTKEFRDFYGDDWKEIALKNPKIVAEYLYKNQGDYRFDNNDRLFLIDLSDNIKKVPEIEVMCKNFNFNEVHSISFDKKINGVLKNYAANAMVVFI
jgi:hypothetical protein